MAEWPGDDMPDVKQGAHRRIGAGINDVEIFDAFEAKGPMQRDGSFAELRSWPVIRNHGMCDSVAAIDGRQRSDHASVLIVFWEPAGNHDIIDVIGVEPLAGGVDAG
ncbi:MAG: hypothetical protein ACREDP_20595, partial [Bradyrhizobium sp.]